jgi:hypothetical protein
MRGGEAMGRVTRSEWRWVVVFAAAAMALLTVPYLIAYSAQGEEWRFNGFLFGVEDGNSYTADMRRGADGAWLFRIPYTTEPQGGALLYLPFLVLGKLAGGAAMHEQLIALYHLARIAAGFALLMALYRFLACFFESVRLRRWGLVAAAFGGGFGWALLLAGSDPLEFTSPEAFGFLPLFGLPHLAAARALLLLALVWILPPAKDENPVRSGAKAGFALVAGWLFQPLSLVTGWAVAGAWLALVFLRARIRRAPAIALRAPLQRALAAAVITIPPLVYSAFSFTLDPVLRQWTAQNTLPAPPILEYLVSYGVLLLPALGGAWLARREDDRWLMPVGWLIAVPALVALPLSIQRRLVEGIWIALVVLALLFVNRVLRERARRAAFVVSIGLLLPAAALFWGLILSIALHPAAPVFLPEAEVRAFLWLDANAGPGEIVLARRDVGNALPAWTDLTAYLGHGPETLHNKEKQRLVETVLDGEKPDAERIEALRLSGAGYVMVDPVRAADLGDGIPGCDLIFTEDGWEIWKVSE